MENQLTNSTLIELIEKQRDDDQKMLEYWENVFSCAMDKVYTERTYWIQNKDREYTNDANGPILEFTFLLGNKIPSKEMTEKIVQRLKEKRGFADVIIEYIFPETKFIQMHVKVKVQLIPYGKNTDHSKQE